MSIYLCSVHSICHQSMSSSSSSSRKRKLSSSTTSPSKESPSSRPKPRVPPKEKRGARYRSSATGDILQRIRRALNQRLYLINQEDKSDTSSSSSLTPTLSKHFAVLGSTGNVYNVIIDKKPSCTCPGRCTHIESRPVPLSSLVHSLFLAIPYYP